MTATEGASTEARQERWTPGPWRWEFIGSAGQWGLFGADGQPLQTAGPPNSKIDRIPDMTLRAAAPELYEALEATVAVLTDEVVGTYYQDDPDWYRKLDIAVEKARAALAKARGEAS